MWPILKDFKAYEFNFNRFIDLYLEILINKYIGIIRKYKIKLMLRLPAPLNT